MATQDRTMVEREDRTMVEGENQGYREWVEHESTQVEAVSSDSEEWPTLDAIQSRPIDPLPEETPSERVLETLIQQLYRLPVILPKTLPLPGTAIHGKIICYDQAADLLNRNKINRFTLDPLLQPWAGPPEGVNRMITLSGNDGTTYLVKAQYSINDHRIYPPN